MEHADEIEEMEHADEIYTLFRILTDSAPHTSHGLTQYNPESLRPSFTPHGGGVIFETIQDMLRAVEKLQDSYRTWKATEKSYIAFIHRYWGDTNVAYLLKVLETDLMQRTLGVMNFDDTYEKGQKHVISFYKELGFV